MNPLSLGLGADAPSNGEIGGLTGVTVPLCSKLLPPKAIHAVVLVDLLVFVAIFAVR
jgi:hypothetical protein